MPISPTKLNQMAIRANDLVAAKNPAGRDMRRLIARVRELEERLANVRLCADMQASKMAELRHLVSDASFYASEVRL